MDLINPWPFIFIIAKTNKQAAESVRTRSNTQTSIN